LTSSKTAPHLPFQVAKREKWRWLQSLFATQKYSSLMNPSAGLDGASKKAFWDWLRSYSNSQRTVYLLLPIRWKKLWLLKGIGALQRSIAFFADVPREVFSHVNTLRRVGLEPPISAELSYELRKRVSFPMALTVGELIRAWMVIFDGF